MAGKQVRVGVRTIHASQGKPYEDPRLSPFISEMKTVFRYSSYRLLKVANVSPEINRTASVSLPGGRTMQITPMQISGNRVKLKLAILKNGSQSFQTVVELLNNGTVTVGGPKHEGGYLLFNISSSF
jgi:hypothetical protein